MIPHRVLQTLCTIYINDVQQKYEVSQYVILNFLVGILTKVFYMVHVKLILTFYVLKCLILHLFSNFYLIIGSI